jgi:hypothetical protein
MDAQSKEAVRQALLNTIREAVKAGIISKEDLGCIVEDRAVRPAYSGVSNWSKGGKR